MNLASFLGLRPLDRVQINDATERREIQRQRRGGSCRPFWFFQRVVGERLEVRAPGGYAAVVRPEDLCDVIAGSPITVQAALPPPERGGPDRTGASSARFPAVVLYATRDRWGFVDPYVLFVDGALNTTGRPCRVIVGVEDRDRLQAIVSRRIMPVMSPRHANSGGTAEAGVVREEQYSRYTVQRLIDAAMRGRDGAVKQLASAGFKRFSTSQMNRLCV